VVYGLRSAVPICFDQAITMRLREWTLQPSARANPPPRSRTTFQGIIRWTVDQSSKAGAILASLISDTQQRITSLCYFTQCPRSFTVLFSFQTYEAYRPTELLFSVNDMIICFVTIQGCHRQTTYCDKPNVARQQSANNMVCYHCISWERPRRQWHLSMTVSVCLDDM